MKISRKKRWDFNREQYSFNILCAVWLFYFATAIKSISFFSDFAIVSISRGSRCIRLSRRRSLWWVIHILISPPTPCHLCYSEATAPISRRSYSVLWIPWYMAIGFTMSPVPLCYRYGYCFGTLCALAPQYPRDKTIV
jgi:hypothetical protein